jgi:Zn-finger nucleic acid-binding protein
MPCPHCAAPIEPTFRYVMRHGNACATCGGPYINADELRAIFERIGRAQADDMIRGTGAIEPKGLL